MQLSPHFTLDELTESSTAARFGLDNTPPPHVVENLRLLCVNVLEPVRSLFNAPVIVSSGYRCQALNTLINGDAKSDHPKGLAADFGVHVVPTLEVCRRIVNAGVITFDQLICEYRVPGKPFSGWVHISFRLGACRQQVLTIDRDHPKGVPGLPDV